MRSFSSVLLPRWEEEVEEGEIPLPLSGEGQGEGDILPPSADNVPNLLDQFRDGEALAVVFQDPMIYLQTQLAFE